MALGAADLTRIYRYNAFTLGSQAGGPLTTQDVMDLIQQQIDNVNAIDTERSTTFAANIQADLARLDTLDTARNANAENGGVKILGIEDGIEYFPGGQNKGYTQEMATLRNRIARILAQTYDSNSMGGVSYAYRG